jgi:sugar lactone lactonase YvrE
MLPRFRLAAALSLFCVIYALSAVAQTPVALPYTMTTLAGLTPMAKNAGTQCPNLPLGVKSTDAYGDGCLAANGVFATGTAYTGVVTDAYGDVFVGDDVNGVLHKINQATGIMTLVAGGNTVCSASSPGPGKLDSSGDGCIAASATPATPVTNARGIGIDYYGNPLLAGYNDHLIHVICLNASPLCVSSPSPTSSNPIQIQIGYMGLVAGCSYGTGSNGINGAGTDNTPGFSLPVSSTFYYGGPFVNAGSGSASCTAALGEVDQPRGATADVYGNVYYGDTASERLRVVLGPQTYNGVTNPLWAILEENSSWSTVTAGYVYTIANTATTATTANSQSHCNGNSSFSGPYAMDTHGDGCLFTSASVNSSSTGTQGVAVDAAGNVIFTDAGNGLLRVFYVSDGTNFAAGTAGYKAGQAMKNAITVNNSSYAAWSHTSGSPTIGFVYMLAGAAQGADTGLSTSPTLGYATAGLSSGITRVTVSPQGNIFIGYGSTTASSNKVIFFDINTGYIRTLYSSATNISAGNFCSGSSGPKSLSTYSDGCPAADSAFGNTGSAVLSIGVDSQGNLYMYDNVSSSAGMLVRKILAQGFSPQTYNTTPTSLTQIFQVHLPESASGTVTGATAKVTSSPDITAAPTTPSCTQHSTAPNADYSVDCTVSVTTAPTQIGQRSAALTVTLPSGTWENASATINLNQTETGSVMVFDNATLGGSSIAPATYPAIFSSITPAAVAVDGAGNVYAASGTSIMEAIGSAYTTLYTLSSSLPATPSQIAVDPAGNIFAVSSTVSTITELQITAAGTPATYTQTPVSYTLGNGITATPKGVAVDQFGNLYVADYQAGGSSVYRLSWSPLSQTYQNQVTVASGLNNPVSLAVDASGNVFVADNGAGKIYEYSPASALTYSSPVTTAIASPDAVAVDAAGDVYVQNGSSVSEFPVSGTETVVFNGLSSPTGLAVDGLGNVYSADSSNHSITQIVRNNLTCNFGTETQAGSATCSGALTNAGNQLTTGSVSPAYFNLSGCGVGGNEIEALSAGESCELSVTMSGTSSTTLTLLPAASTVGSLTLEGTLQAPTYNTTTSISGPTPSSPIYVPSGTEATFTVTVAPAAGSGYSGTAAPGGTPLAWVCQGSAACPYGSAYVTLTPTALSQIGSTTSSSATVNVSGLTAGTYNINASYPGGSSTGPIFSSSSTSSGTSFPIGQVSTAVSSWTPSVSTQQVSSAIGAGVLNATATPAGIAGNFVYTATCTSGNCTQYSNTTIDASTYLPLGTYTLGVTFVPTDLTDYVSSPSTNVSYSVTQASTTASVGASTNVVASDGSGNYTSLSAALATLPITGGTLYLKPGTYTGQNAISYPNVRLRGLGGNPANVLLIGENGNFTKGGPYPQSSGTAFGPGPAGNAGDEGSAVLDVSKNNYMGTTLVGGSYSPAGFYAEYLTIQNTYDTDPVTTSTTTASGNGGTCNFSGITPYTLQYLYTNNLSCGSQAQALYMNADQAILNNVNLTSQQDTLYAGYQGTSGSTYVPSRQYIWKGLITGDVDFIYGDAALVLDHANIFTAWHGTSAAGGGAGGTETITAQSKRVQTGSGNDYLSGYICNACTLMSQTSTADGGAMSKLYYGRPYPANGSSSYSTFVLLNSHVDQVAPAGWIGWDGASEYLPTSTYAEFNTQAYTDPAVGTSPYPSILFYPTTGAGGVIPSGGNIGYGVTSASTPAAARESSALQLTAALAAPYYPLNFLSTAVSTTGGYSGMPATWNPMTAIANAVNSFAPTSSVGAIGYGSSVTILGRPQTPGAGVVPTGSYAFYDNLNTDAACSAVAGNCSLLASGNLDASGEAYLTTTSLGQGLHYITMVYGGDANFAASTTANPYPITVVATLVNTTTALSVTNTSSTYGGTISGTVTVTPASGSDYAVGAVTLYSGLTALGSCALVGTSNTCGFSLSHVAAGVQAMTASYAGGASLDGNETFGGSSSGGVAFTVNQAVLHVTASNASVIAGGAMPTFGYTVTGYLNSDTSAVLSGAPAITTTATTTNVIGEFPINITTGTLSASNYTFTFTGAYLYVTGTSQAAAVATGDTRTVTEPSFPAVCQQLTAAITEVKDDIPASVDAANSNPDSARIQAALNNCSANYPGQAVELSVDSTGAYNAFLSGPLTMPSNVTLLVDPGVVLFFSRNAQDYDIVSGTHTCGTVVPTGATVYSNTGSVINSTATKSCLPLIDIPGTSSNVGIMGFGKLDGRGGDTLLNPISPYQNVSWWGLSSDADNVGNQMNPRFIQMDTNSSNITLYKITIRNAPLFHVSTTGAVSGITAWDVKIVTPTTSRNTDGIDPGNVTNVTITRSWISDGDDNVAVGGAGTTAPASNISVTNNHFFAGHGQSIGSNTSAGISNVLWDGNIAAGNGFAGTATASYGSSISSTGTFLNGAKDSNSTGIRIKSSNSSGGLVTNIQYSNECLLDHDIDIQFTPYYSSGDSIQYFPSYQNILLQNVVFANDDSSTGTVEMTGEYNTNLNPTNGTPSPVINPLSVRLDNVTFAPALTSLVNSTTPVESTSVWGNGNYSGGEGQYASITYGPGDVSNYVYQGTSTNFVAAYANLVNVSANNDTLTNSISSANTSTAPPSCSYTYIAPELTGPMGLPQVITQGQAATAVVILTPAVGGAAYPTGTVKLTDALTSSTYTAPLSGNTDTVLIPLTGLTAGEHTFTAAYSGDSNYVGTAGVYTTTPPYLITVNSGSLSATSTSVGLPVLTSVNSSYGTAVTATATVTGSNPTGSVQFVVSGGGLTGSYTYTTATLTSSSGTTSTASASINLAYSGVTAYSITAVYSGDSVNASSTSSAASLTVGAANTQTNLTVTPPSAALGNPLVLTATVTSAAGIPAAAPVTFAYSTSLGGAQTTLGNATLSSNGVTTYYLNSMPVGSYYFFASYQGGGDFNGSASAGVAATVTPAVNIVQLPSNPIALPYTMTTIAGGGAAVPSGSGNMACAGATNKYGDGCQAAAIAFTSGDDMRAVTADPFGNVYLSDISATRVRRITPNGVITTFAGGGSTCTPPASTSAMGTGCIPTEAALSKPRGVGSDAAGNVFISDYSTDKVFEVKVSDGLMYLVAGTGTAGSTGDGGLATSATVDQPRSAWDDSLGNIYIADTSANKVRVVDTLGNIHTFAGAGGTTSTGDGGPATAANFDNPQGVFVDPNLNVYVTDSVGRIRVICVTCGTGSPLDTLLGKLGINSPVNGYIYTIAGNGNSLTAYSGTWPAPGTSVSMAPQKLSMDNSGNLYISDSLGFVWLLDFRTGYIRAIAKNGTVCGSASSAYGYAAYGDGCPATQAIFGSNGGNGMGAGVDTQGNLYISDSSNVLIRKVITGLVSPSTADTATTPLSQPVQIHFIPGDTLANSNGLVYTSSEWTLGTPACTNNTTTDNTADCLLTSAFKPKVPGLRSTPLTVNSSLSNTANLALTGIGSGAGATLDPASQISFGTGLSVAGLATDNAGNVYVSDAASKNLYRYAASVLSRGTGAPATTLATLTAPGAVAVDPRGYVYVADTSTGLITQVAPAGTVSTLPFTFTTPAGLTVDALNNLYVSDSSAQAVYQINLISGLKRNLNLGTLVTPKGLAIDPSGNLLIADPGVPAIYRYNFATGTRTTVSTTASAPSTVVTDAAGNLLIADAADILAVPASSNSASFTVAGTAPSALAIDSAGNLYTGSNGGVLELVRTQASAQFAGPSAPPQAFSMLESGNQALSPASLAQSDPSDYSLTAAASMDCTVSAGHPTALAIGGVCALTASYTPTTYVPTTDTVTVSGAQNAALSTPNLVQLTLTGPATAPASSITISSFSPVSPVYGQSVTVYATVTGIPLPPVGNVVFTLDGTTTYSGTVNSGVASASLPNLSAGLHSVTAAYTSSNGYAPSTTSSAARITVTPAPLTVTANNTSRAVGAANPAFTASYSGFVNGETTAVLSGAPSLTTTATTSSPAGLYPITAAVGTLAAANYNFTFVNGTLSVVAAPSVSITNTSTLTGSHSAGYTLTITIQNTGTGPVPNLVLTSATLGTTSGSPLPQTWGTIPVAGAATFTVAFPGSVGTDGAGVAEKYAGTYTGGSFSTSLRSVTLP